MVLLDDVIVATSAAVTTTSLIVLVTLLARYRSLEREAYSSAQLAKNIYDSMNLRFSVQEARIVDLMAKLEVYSSSRSPNITSKVTQEKRASRESQERITSSEASMPIVGRVVPPIQSVKATTTTGAIILKTLLEGPKTSNQILEVIQVSREHNGRLLKELFDRGLVVRNDQHKPFVYEITETGRRYVSSP